MLGASQHGSDITLLPEVVLLAYRHGFFPMADAETGQIDWHRPDPRAIIPLNGITLTTSLRKTLRRNVFRISVDTCFRDVMESCAQRNDTWISDDMIDAYSELHSLGYAHSVEAWQGNLLVGGLYGVHIGGAFMGESMFSTATDASKVAFAHLAAILITNGFSLLDTQYINDHTARFGAIEVSDASFQLLLGEAVCRSCQFDITAARTHELW